MKLSPLAFSFMITPCSNSDEPASIAIDNAAELVAFSVVNHTYGIVNDIIRGVQSGLTELNYNGTYSRSGLWTCNLDYNHIDNVTSSRMLNNLKAEPSDGRITVGTAKFMIIGTSNIHDSYCYEGNIEFQGSDNCFITFRAGEQYELNLETDTITLISTY